VNDVICARITAAGIAAIAVIRICGKGCIPLVAKYFRPADKLLKAAPNSVIFGTFYDPDSNMALDEVLLSVFHAPKSYTGEDTVELSCHGNPALTDRILTALLSRARLANPGEFTLRAYLNGKMDLSQAEAVNDLILASSSKAETAALMQIKGYLGKHLSELLQDIQDARLRCELAIDFSDQDLPQIDVQDLGWRLANILSTARALQEEGRSGIKLREGIKICLAGAPNSGKSSLFNAFLKQKRAIVTPHPGTTRDYLEESFSLSGYPIVLYDTAGLRDSEDEIEKEGIARSYALIQNADLILYLYEGDFTELPEDWQAFQDKLICVAAKADIYPQRHIPQGHVESSALCPNGLKALSDAILQRLKLPAVNLEHPLITNVRHLAALSRSISALEAAQAALQQELGWEFIAFELILAVSALEEILGLTPSDELLGRIFDEFCIGK
jgi:tRNA modification GTPase